MALTVIQRDAIARAKQGDFGLLDAMELQHRMETRQVLGGYLIGGRLRYFETGNHSGGIVYGRKVIDMDGLVIFRGHPGDYDNDPSDGCTPVEKAWCTEIIDAYRKSKAEAAEAQAEAAKPPFSKPYHNPIFPETQPCA